MPDNVVHAEPAAAASDEPAKRECLRCYLVRMLAAHGCDNTKRWTIRWRDRRAPHDMHLVERVEERGGLCCDCEVIFNVWEQQEEELEEEQEEEEEHGPPSTCVGMADADTLVPCAGWYGCTVAQPRYPDEEDDYYDDDQWEGNW
jgi:hypothetical protein